MRRILIISPCRDEADHLAACIASVAAQSVKPTLWVIVDDGSTDDTPQVLADAARAHDFIRIVRRENRGQRSVGPGVIEAFYAGLDAVMNGTISIPTSDSRNADHGTHQPDMLAQSGKHATLADRPTASTPEATTPPTDSRHSAPSTQHSALPFDFLGKFDADLELPPTYLERCLAEFDRDPYLGNFSGKVYLRDADGTLTPERMGDENAIGAAKLYRTACFEDIDGFVRHAGWDGIDGHMCRLRGWVARSADEPDLRIIHRRLMGSSHLSIAHGRRRWGLAKWYMGSSLPYMLAVAAYRMLERPIIRGGLWILQGYLQAMLARKPRLETPGFRAHLRRYEWASLLRGKSRTADAYHTRIRAARRAHSERALSASAEPSPIAHNATISPNAPITADVHDLAVRGASAGQSSLPHDRSNARGSAPASANSTAPAS